MRIKTSLSNSNSIGGKIGGSLFLSIFFAAGCAFFIFFGLDYLKTVKTYAWDKTPCTIIQSSVASEGGENPYKFKVEYEYTVDGKKYTSSASRRTKQGFSEFTKAQKLANKYPAASPAQCYVDPTNPSEAILQHDSLFIGLFLAIPTIFMLVGGGGIYFLWKRPAKHSGKEPVKQISKAKKPKGSRGSKKPAVIFFGIFFLFGFGFLYGFFLRPVIKIQAAKSWTPTECTIISSSVQRHSGEDSDTFSVDILYEYSIDGAKYKSNNYHFMGGSSSGSAGKRKIVNAHKPGSTTTCFVNPDDRFEAVINRGYTPTLFFGLIPMIFVVIGLVGMIYSIRGPRKKSWTGYKAEWLPKPKTDSAPGQRAILKPTHAGAGKIIFLLIFWLIWTGVVAFMFIAKAKGDGPPWFFCGIFGLADIGIFIGLIYSILASFNAKPTVIISNAQPRLGETINISYLLKGKTSAISALTLHIEGREEATYTRGTDTVTDKNVFETIELVETEDSLEVQKGSIDVNIPETTIHSFAAINNKIVWCIKIHGDIQRWPDINQEYELIVLPKEI
jgi:hypothetical protein